MQGTGWNVYLCCATGSVCKVSAEQNVCVVRLGLCARRYIVDQMFTCVVQLNLCARCLLDKMFICVVQLGLCASTY